jgi:hypothetical protein
MHANSTKFLDKFQQLVKLVLKTQDDDLRCGRGHGRELNDQINVNYWKELI